MCVFNADFKCDNDVSSITRIMLTDPQHSTTKVNCVGGKLGTDGQFHAVCHDSHN